MNLRDLRNAVPWGLVVLRAIGGPTIMLGSNGKWPGDWLAILVLLALLSDVYDGILARRWGVETPALRVWDSIADTVF
jgi:phosphatidylglycerophosphate synthase